VQAFARYALLLYHVCVTIIQALIVESLLIFIVWWCSKLLLPSVCDYLLTTTTHLEE
jgi:hypothetical protein